MVPLEERVAEALRALLHRRRIGFDLLNDEEASERLRQFLGCLAIFIPEVLRSIYPEWDRESLDGFDLTVARKTHDLEAELFGLCILISDQSLTPIHVCLQIDAAADEVTWLECRLGELGAHGLVRTPYNLLHAALRRMLALNGRADQIDWVYKVAFGRRGG